ncbi:dystonin isoform X3 [Polypterus senegalus]|uniref:dystonin isoform X3 n=1 Tax=Polypterus senegalus TaxID=55291 RepID=UPI001964781B|nr:dystonin isoform X3 [Polypterus senegalus]
MAGHYIPSAYLYAADEQEYLQAYEDVLERYKDERDRVQKKTFTKWINQHLLKVRKHVNDLYEDLRDGHNLISLLEVLSGETLPRERDFLKTLRLVSAADACAFEQHEDEQDDDKGPREKGRMRFHRLQNVQIALDYLKKRQVKLVNIRNDDITDGNPKLTLGLIWTIILHFQISDIHVTGESEDMTAKERLLLWSQQSTDGYVGVRCENFTTCWRDGRLFNAIIHKYRPDLIDMNMVASQCSRINLEQAFNVAEQLGVARLLDPEDVDVQSPDEKSVITYVSTLYDVFPKVLEGSEGINANDVDIKWVEYQNMVNYLSQWIKHHVTVMSDRTYPNSPVELKALYNQYLKFKESEIPLKENEKARIKHLYRLLEPWIEFGRIKLPQGYHPNDVEKEWGKLIIAMLEREKSLRPEVERLEMLQQIANRVQRDCVAGEDKLILARNALQSDAKRLESGIQFQNEAEIAGYLLECETLLRQQVVDIQILLDGKFYLADQLVQRVSKIRDDLFTLKSECSSVYSKGRSLTTEQTKRMISGITQSLNSGFSQSLSPSLPSSLSSSLTPSLMPGLSPGLTSSYTSSLTPSQTPSLTPGITPGLQSPMVPSYLGGMDSGSLQTLKLMQIRKPLLKSSLADPSLTEEEVNMKFVQDLLNWVEEMQLQLDRAEWGSDLQSVESHFENHKNVHGAIEEFQMSLKEAKISEIQMTPPLKHSYSEKLGRLESQYGKLLNTSRNRQKHLDTLHEFVSKATRELIWLNEKEEEEVSYDWSDRSSNLAKKKDYHADLMRILDDKERVIKSVQEMAEQLLLENHPARLTIEAYRAAMQTQWSWVLQLCGCVEQHLKENTLYFEFFSDARESMDYLKNLQETIQRKYSCDRTSSLHKLEDLIQESMDEKEQLLQYRSTVASLVGRAKAIVQLKLRSPDSPIRTSIPVKAICDYRQIEITIYKDDECVLASNSHRAKWKIISPTGNEAMVPSVCFTIPPPNKEAIEYASRIEQLYQNVLALWHQSHINMKSVVSWRYLMNDIEAIRNGKVASIKTMLPGEHQQVLSNLQTHFEDFLDDTEESEIFTVSDRNHLEREVEICKQYYEELLKSAEREEHEESVYNLFISDMRNFRMRLESCEERLIRQIRTPLQRDDLQESALRIAEQEKSKKELDRLKEDLETMKGKCEMFLNQASASPSASTLSSELNLVVQNMNQIYSMSAIYLEKLKTVNLVVKNSQAAEALVKLYEAKLCEEDAVNADAKAIESVMGTLKQWRTEIDEKREVFHDLEDELQKARTVSERMFKTHNERDFDLDWHKEKADQLAERWQSVHSQVESRLRDLEGISKSLRYYKDTYFALNDWIKEMEATQLRMQENQPEDSKALAELLNQQKVLVSEIEVKQSKIDECQKYSEQYSAAVKDYELQLMTYRAMVDSQHKSPVKRRRMQSSSDMIIQEFMDLRTCYTALVTLMTQYIKYASETLKRTEEEEYSSEDGDFYMELLYGEAEDEFLCTGLEMKNTMRAFLPPDTLNNERDADLETAEDYFLTQRKDELEFAPLEGNSGDGEHTKGQFSGNSEKLQRVMCASQISDTGQQNLQEVYASENSRAKLNFRVCDAHRQLGRMFEDVGGKIDSPKGEGTSLTLEKEPDFGMWKSLCGDPEETWRRFSFTSPIGKESIMDLDAILQIIEDGDELNAYQEMLISREQMKRDRVIQERLQIVLDRMEDCYFSSDLCSDTEERWFHPNFKKDSMILGCEPLPGLEITYDEYLNVGSSLFGFPLETIPEEILESESQQTSLQSSKKSFCVKQVPKAETYKGNAKNTPHLVEEAQSLDQATSLKSVETTPGYHLRAINSDSMASGLQEEKMLWWPNGAFLEEDLGEENVVTILDGSQAFTEQQSSGFSSFIKDHEEKSVEEEKKEHGEKVNKLLNWVSRVKKEERPLEDGTNEPSYMPQVSMEDVARKKEQISEALRATQMILTKHSDKMTEEEKQETKEQLKSLQQAYNDLSQQPLDQLHQPQSLPAEQEHQVIQGILDLETGAVFSVPLAMQKGLVDCTTGILLLEAQLVTTGLVSPESMKGLDLEEAFQNGLIDQSTYSQLQEIDCANKNLQRYSSDALPVIRAVTEGAISEALAFRIINIHLASGGLKVSRTGEMLSLQTALQNDLIPESLFVRILETEGSGKHLVDPNTAEKLSLAQTVQRSRLHGLLGLRVLDVKKRKDGRISLQSGGDLSIFQAILEGRIDQETAVRLLGAQLFAGGIIDPESSHKLNVEEAIHKGLIDEDMSCAILSYQVQNGGIVDPHGGKRLTLDEAVQCNLMSSRSALLVLERQGSLKGLICPNSGETFTVSSYFEYKEATTELDCKLPENRHQITALYIPDTSKVLNFENAEAQGMLQRTSTLLLKSTALPDSIPNPEEMNENAAKWTLFCNSCVDGHDLSESQLPHLAPVSASEAKRWFISYLMINSYVDPKSGQRVLIYERELDKMTSFYTEKILLPDHDNFQIILSAVPQEPGKEISTLLHQCFNTEVENISVRQSLETTFNNDIGSKQFMDANAFDGKEVVESVDTQGFLGQVQEQHDKVKSETTPDSEVVANIDSQDFMHLSSSMVGSHMNVQNDFLLLDEPMDTTPTNHHQNLNIQEDPHHDLVTEPVMDHNHIFETNLSDSKTDYRMHQNKIAQILTEGCTLPQMAVVEKEEALFASEPNKICNSCELDWTSLRNMNSPHDISESHSCNPITPDMSRSHNGEVDKLTSELSLGRHTDKQEHFLKEQSLHTEAMTIKCLEFDKYSVQSLENQPGPLDECTDEELKLEPYIKKSSFGEQMIIEELSAETREGEVIKDRSREMLTLGDCTQHKHVVVDTSDELNDHQDLTATDNVKSNVKLLSSDDDCMVEKISVSESKRNSDAIEVHAAPEEATVKLQLEEVSAMKYALLESEEEMLGDVQGKSWLKEEEKAELCLEPEKLLCVMEADHRVEMPTLVQVRASHDFQHQLISASIESSVGVLRDTDRAIPHERSDGGEMFDGTREEHWGNCELSIEEQFIEGMSASDMTLSQDCGLPRTTVTISDQPCKSTITDKQIFPNFDITYSVNKTRQTCKRAQTEEHCDPKISQAIRKSHKFDQDSVSSLGLLSEMTRSSNSEPTDIVSNEGQLSLLTKRNKMGIENLPGDPSKNGDDHYLEEDSSTNVLSSFVNSDEEEPTSDPAGTLFLKSSEVYRFGLEDKYSKAVECHDSIPGVLHPLTEMKINARNNYNNLELSENGKSEHLKAFNNSEIETETEYENLEQISGIGESSGNYPYVPNLEPEKTSDDQESDTLDDSIEESQNASPQAVILSGGADVETNELFQANRPQEEPPEMSDLYHTLRSNWQDLMKVKVTDTTVEVLQKAESKVIEGMIKIINNAIQSSGGLEDASDSSDDEDRDDALTCIDSRSPDILIDLLKQSGASTMADTIPEMKKGELFKESPHRVPKSVTPAELLQEQLQRLFHISPRGTDPDLNAQLNEILVGFMQREGPPAVEGVKSGQMAEATDRGTRLCPLIKADAELKEREKHEEGSESSEEILKGKKNGNGKPLSCTQHYLECIGRLQDHSDVLEDLKEDLNSQELIGHTLEILTEQLDSSESLESQLSALSGTLAADLKTAECLLESTGEHVPTQIRRDLEAVCKDLQLAFADICKMAAERRTCIKEATALEKSKIKALKQDLLDRLQRLADFIQDNTKTITSLDIMNTDDLETVKYRIQHNKDLEKALSAKGHELDTTAFDVQYFISEYAQDLLPSDSRDLLRTLSTTQRSFKEIMEMVSTQRDTLMLHLEIRRDLSNQKTLAEKQKEYTEKLEEMCHLLTQTENRIIGHQQTTLNKDSLGDLQQYQTEHQALQRDVQAGQSALAEIVKSSNKFLEENQGKLHPDQVALIESRVDEAKRKSKLLSQRAEESRKELDKALTTAIKQETAKVAAEEQLEDSKNKIKGLLGWLSNIGKDQGVDENLQEQMVKQNGNLPLENRSKLNGQEDDANGNLPQLNGQTCTVTDGKRTGKDDLDLSKQHDRVKAHHREILSQQQAFIIATQSAQALLEKQGHMLSPGEKEKLQSNIQELRDRYETTLTEAELKMKLIQTVQDELQKFRTDCGEFENWLQQSETEIAELKSGVSDQDHLNSKLQRQKSFSDDVISHKGDLRFITISGQRVLDAAKMCNKSDTSKDSELSVDTSGVSTLVQDKLESAANHYKSLHSQCYLLGNNLKDVVEKYKHYGDASSGIVTWLEDAEETARKQLAEVIAVDPQDLQKQLEDTKVLHGQVSGRQGAIEKLRKAADAVIATEGNLLTNCDEIQRSVGDVVERYDNLAKSVSDRNETLQITLTRSLSVQDGLDEMLDWMKNVEKSLEEQEQVPLHSTAIQEALSKEAMLEQDIVSRQSSIAAMKEKVSKFIETADPSTASSLQAKMNTLSKRFTDASQKHREKVHKLEELKDKVDMFEKTAEKVQQFVAKGSRTLTETDGPGKNVNELSQLMQETNAELTDQAKDIEVLQKLSAELADLDPDGSHSHIQKTIETLSRNFKDFEDTVKEKEEEVSSCQGQLQAFKNTVESLQRWLDESTEKLAMVQPSCSVEEHEKSLQTVKALSEEWTAKAPAVEDVNRKGSEVCNLISVLTSPAKTKSSVKAGKAVVNGSGPHGYLTNKELMLVQQHLTYVNQSYDNLGEHLKEKRGELEGALQDLSVVHNEGDSLKQWLTDMQKEVTSWNTGQAGNESVKTQMEQHKSLEVELKVKQGQLQQLKEKLSDLLEKHPQSSEAEKWKQMLDQIDSTWKDVTSSMEERKEKLEESSRNLAQFQTNEEQLKQWLAEKELMLGVLGPLSIDPNMLKAQKQQVQILLKEFDSRKSQYEQLKEAAQSILSQPGDLSPSCTAVKSQLAAITDKWEGVTGQLTDRSDRIDEAIVKTSQFQEVLRNLSEQVNALGQSLGGPSSLSTQPDAVKQQLETAMDVRSKLDQEKTRVAEAEALCKELSALVGEEYLKADLSRQLESILKPFKDLEEKAGNRIEQLNLAFASSQQFNQMSRNFHEWLDGKVQDLSKVPPLSANMEVLHRRIKEHATYQTSLEEQSGPYKKIVQEGEALLQTTQGAERTALQNQLATLQGKWDTLRKQSADYSERAQVCLKQAQKYKEHLEKVQPWIEDCEKQLTQVTVSVDPAEVDCSISRARTLQKDVDKHRGVVELFHNAADSLLEVTQADHEPVKEEKANVTQKVENISEILQQKRDTLDKIAQRLKEFNDTHKEVREHLKGARQQLTVHESLGAQVYSNKHLTNMKAQQKALETLGTQVGSLKGLAQGLVVDASDAAGVSDLLLKVESLDTEFKSVKQQVEDVSSFLETKLQGIGQFQNSIREMFSQFSDLDDELDSMQPVGRDLDVLRLQKEDMRNFIKKLQELIDNTATANKNCQQMLEKEGSPDLPGLKRDLEALNKQCGKLMDRAKGRQDQVEAIYSRVDEFYQKLKELSEKCIVVEEHEESQGAVRMEIEIVNQQLDAFKVFQKEEIEPLQGKLQDVNWIGQGLIQSAAKTTNTQKLEQDLEDINMRCNTLNKKVAERAALLHEALLHCGRFQDALESLLSWLTDTEELVANQKPPSAEFKVVKAQIQEQKLLQRLLEDRKPTVDIIKREGEKISASVESPDKEKTLKELVTLGQRWESLLGKAETRHRQLECILVVAQQFHETLEPLTEWLTSMEKRLANTEPIGTQTKKLEEQISQHKALEDDIMAHSKNLHQAISVGQTLKTLSSPDDKDSVQSKVDSAQSQFGELQETSGRKAAMLQQAFSNAQHFGEDEVALMNWLSEVHEKLSNVAVHDYHPDLLQKQDAEQRGLHVDIIQKKQNVDLAIQNGLELLKQTTGDEVLIIQEKLDGIKARYAEINTMSGNVSKLLNQALTLSTRLFQTHEELCQWLGGVEAEVVTFEAQVPVGEQLSQVQERQKDLLKDVKDHKALVSSLNEVSSSLLELVPWRAREGLDKLVSEDNERYKLVSDALVHHVEEIDATILRSQQFEQAADVEFAWLSDMETKLLSQGDIRLEQDQTTSQLQAQKAFSMDILRHKDNIDEILKKGEAMLDNSDEEEKASLKEKIRQLLEKYDVVSHINSERCLQLERAHSLASQFWETYDELWPWLQDIISVISQLPAPAIEYETLKQQQEELRQMRELIAEHKPHIDKMNKTGPQLLQLSPTEGLSIQEKYTASDQLYAQIKENVKQRAAALDEAMSKSTQLNEFHDKIDPMLETLKRIVERLRTPPSISVEVEKIKEQINENKNVLVDLEKLQPVFETLKQRGQEMIARSEGADKDVSAKAVQEKLDLMVFIWEDIHALLEERETKLLDVMDLAEKFWCDHSGLIATIKDTQDLLRELEEPGVDPSVVKQQQETAESFGEEIEGLQEELDAIQNLGDELMSACGEPDKPVIKKSIDELNTAFDNLNKNWKERMERLEEAMQSAVQFQDGLQGMFDWVDILEGKIDSMSPVGTDLETVKQQIVELKEFKAEAYQLQIEMEKLNHQAELLLKKVVEEDDKHAIQDPFTELKLLWDNLDEKIVNRQHKLEDALLALGQFQHALDELLTWMTHTEELLNEQKKTTGDPKAIEIELAKHHVLQNDVLAHKTTVEAVNIAGNDLIESSAGEEASNLQNKLESLKQRWEKILEKTEQRRQQLDSALLQAQGFHGEIEDMQHWLKETERQLLASKGVGGLPETAREQLNVHLELCGVFELKEELYKKLMAKGEQLIAICPESHDSNTQQDLLNLREKWESVQAKMTERKVKLEEALTLATEFHNSLQDFINWLTQAEQTLTMATSPSLIMDTILFQIDEHKVFVTEVNSHRDQIIELDKTGTHLKYFSQKQDVVLIKNLLISVQSRWEKVVQRSVERGRTLDDARKRAKQFSEAWNKLMEWLEESEKALDSELEIANDPDKIKLQLAQHKEFQKALGAKHSMYDTTLRSGRSLKEKTSLNDDNQKLDDMLSELRDKWDTVCGKSVERCVERFVIQAEVIHSKSCK